MNNEIMTNYATREREREVVYTSEDLKQMQSWSLERKIQVTQTRLLEWYQKWDNKCYVSFSGGKDSTVLAHLTAQVCKSLDCKLVLWFSDTGLEYPEIKEHVKIFGEYLKNELGVEVETIIDYPKDRKGKRINFRYVIERFGYPLISKEISHVVYNARNAIDKGTDKASWALKKLNGTFMDKNTGKLSMFNYPKWKFLLNADFRVSHYCCEVMKKRPAHKFSKSSGLKPIIGTMASESLLRRQQYLKHGCNAFTSKNPSSQPLSFWKEQDIYEYIIRFNLPIASVYGEIKQDEKGKYYTTGVERTGCIFCGFGCHLEKEPNRFQKLKQTHPKIWDYCMKPWDEGGLGMQKVLNYIGVKTE